MVVRSQIIRGFGGSGVRCTAQTQTDRSQSPDRFGDSTSKSLRSPSVSIWIVARAGTALGANHSAQASFIAGFLSMSVTKSVVAST